MALIGAILVEIKIIEILCERLLREGDRHALKYGIGCATGREGNKTSPILPTPNLPFANIHSSIKFD